MATDSPKRLRCILDTIGFSFLKGLRPSPLQLRETAVASRGSRALAPWQSLFL